VATYHGQLQPGDELEFPPSATDKSSASEEELVEAHGEEQQQ